MRASCQVDKESEQLFLDLRGFMCAAARQYLAEHPGSTSSAHCRPDPLSADFKCSGALMYYSLYDY